MNRQLVLILRSSPRNDLFEVFIALNASFLISIFIRSVMLYAALQARRDVWKLLDGELDEGRSLLLSSHSMEECEAHCSRIGVLCRGRLIAIGDSQTLKNRFKILEPCFFSSFCFNSG